MADTTPVNGNGDSAPFAAPLTQRSLDEARAVARQRFKSRFEAGEKIGGCACHEEDEPFAASPPSNGESDQAGEPAVPVAGVRFRDSGRTFYFRADAAELAIGDWVVVETSRGREAGRVVIAPHQVRLNLLEGDLKPILDRLDDEDVRRMDGLKRESAAAVKAFGAHLRRRGLPLKPISAEYAFDGSSLVLHYSTPTRERSPDGATLRRLASELGREFGCDVELRQVGPRDEARLLGGVGRCGRTLCCSSWLPVYPEISMNMAKTQDLPLNPGKVSGVCGRLLCCLSYENEQYKQMKAVMPRLGQTIETPAGPGIVISMQLLKELVTVRLQDDPQEIIFSSAELGLGGQVAAPSPDERSARPEPDAVAPAAAAPIRTDNTGDEPEPAGTGSSAPRRRRRRRGRRGGADGAGSPASP